MAQIKNKTKYPIKVNPKSSDYFIGSDSDRSGQTVNFEIASVISTIKGVGEQNRIVSGAPIWIPNTLSYTIPKIEYFLSGTLYNTTPTTITLDNGGALPRIDVIAVTTTSQVVVFKGTEAASPIKPSFPSSTDYLELTFVNIAAGATIPTGASAKLVYENGTGQPTEFNATENTGGNGITLNYFLPDTNQTVIKTLRGTIPNGTISFATTTPQVFNATDHFQLTMAKHEIFTPNMKFEMSLWYLGVEVTSKLTINSTLFGFDNNIVDDFQTLIIPFFKFIPPVSFYDRIDIKITNIPFADVFIDTITKISGVVLPPPLTTVIPVKTSQLINDGEDGVNPFANLQDIQDAIAGIPTTTPSLQQVTAVGASTTNPITVGTTPTHIIYDKDKLRMKTATSDNDVLFPAPSVPNNPVNLTSQEQLNSAVSTLNSSITTGDANTLASANAYTDSKDLLKEDKANKGIAGGYASLDGTGKVPAVQLPSYVDDVLEFANLAAFPVTGETGKIYVALDTNKTYRWSGSIYVEISPSAVNSVFGRTGNVVAQNADYNTSLVPDTTNRRYQTDVQSANNDATSSIQTQLNARELLANKQNTLVYDGTGVKYSTVDAVNNLSRNIVTVCTKTGLLSKNDTFNLIALSNTVLRIAPVTAAIFWNELAVAGTAPSAAIRAFAQKDYSLTDLITATGGNVNLTPLTTDGKYVRYMGYDKNGNVYSSPTTMITNNDIFQLGFITVLKVGSAVSFLDGTTGPRNVLALPDMAANTDFDKVSPITTNVVITPNAGASIATSDGSITGISVNWKSASNPSNGNPIDVFPYTGVTPAAFRSINPLFLSATAGLSTHTLWTELEDGIQINNKFFNTTTQSSGTMANGSASLKRVLIGIRGSIYVQDAEFPTTACYVDLATARNNIFTHKFSDAISPTTAAFEIARIAYVKGATAFTDTTQFYVVSTGGGVSGAATGGGSGGGDATPATKGIIKLAGDFDPSSTADVPVIKEATASVRGVVTPNAQTFAGTKTLLDGLKYTKGIPLTGGTDLNTIIDAGFYTADSLLNAPDAGTGGGGTYNITVESTGNPNYLHQTVTSIGISNTGNRIFSRVRIAGTWSPWKEIITTNSGESTLMVMSDGSRKAVGSVIKTRKDITGVSYTVVSSDVDKILYTTNSSPVTITIPSGLTASQEYEVIQYGAGPVVFATSGTTLRLPSWAIVQTAEQYSRVIISWVNTEEYQLMGDLLMI